MFHSGCFLFVFSMSTKQWGVWLQAKVSESVCVWLGGSRPRLSMCVSMCVSFLSSACGTSGYRRRVIVVRKTNTGVHDRTLGYARRTLGYIRRDIGVRKTNNGVHKTRHCGTQDEHWGT